MQSFSVWHSALEQKHKWYADWHTISRFKYYHWSFLIAVSLLVGTTVIDQINRTFSIDIPTTILRVRAEDNETVVLTPTITPASAATIAPGPGNHFPRGIFEEIRSTDGLIRGWSYDPDNSSASNVIQIFIDGPGGTGTLVGSILTNLPRIEVNGANDISGNHGIEFIFPPQFRDGVSHSVYLYGMDLNDSTKSILLAGSPKSFSIKQ